MKKLAILLFVSNLAIAPCMSMDMDNALYEMIGQSIHEEVQILRDRMYLNENIHPESYSFYRALGIINQRALQVGLRPQVYLAYREYRNRINSYPPFQALLYHTRYVDNENLNKWPDFVQDAYDMIPDIFPEYHINFTEMTENAESKLFSFPVENYCRQYKEETSDVIVKELEILLFAKAYFDVIATKYSSKYHPRGKNYGLRISN